MSWVFREMRIDRAAGEIDSAATRWAVRADRGLAPKEEQELRAWLDADTRHVGAFARAKAMLTPVSSGAAAVVSESQRQLPRRSTFPRRALIAAAVATMAGGYAFMASAVRKEKTYSTATGEVRAVPLADGSRITLNTGTRVDVALSDTDRQLTLHSGEAFFEVAADKSRPFIVDADGSSAKAVGTAFTVRRLDAGWVEVIVYEGVVEVSGPAGNVATLEANMRAEIEDQRGIRLTTLDGEALDRKLAWRDGKIGFTGESLADAVREFNRYNTIQIDIAGEELARRTITGWFSSRDPEAFAKAVASSFDAAITVFQSRIELAPRKT
jgi:transmembrane sensor